MLFFFYNEVQSISVYLFILIVITSGSIIFAIIYINLHFSWNLYRIIIFTITLLYWVVFWPYISFIKSLANPMSLIHPFLILNCFRFIWGIFTLGSSRNYIGLAFSFILGGFWAFQEYNWGGWWNWDLIETPLFLYVVFFLVYVHVWFRKKRFASIKIISGNHFYILFLFILTLNRFIVSSSIHSFQQNKFRKIYFIYFYSIYAIRACKFLINFFHLKTLDNIVYIITFSLYVWSYFFFKKKFFWHKVSLLSFKKIWLHKFIMFSTIIMVYFNIKVSYYRYVYRDIDISFYQYTSEYSRIYVNHIYFFKYMFFSKLNSVKFILYYNNFNFYITFKNLIK